MQLRDIPARGFTTSTNRRIVAFGVRVSGQGGLSRTGGGGISRLSERFSGRSIKELLARIAANRPLGLTI